jgi:predicted AAA+ superfamily ATPase
VVGGFPEVQQVSGDLHRRILQEYVDVALYRDVVERHRVSNTVALRHLVRRLLRSPASRISIHRLYGDFRSMGLSVGKDLLHEYLGYLEDAFMVFTVSIDSTSEKQKTVNPRKCYLVDHALAETVRFTTKEDRGFYLENVVYLELRRRGYEVSYYVTASGREVDFCVRTRGEIVGLLQVTWDLSDPTTRDREMGALAEAMKETATKQGMIVTLREQKHVRIDHGTISFIPAWRFLLET